MRGKIYLTRALIVIIMTVLCLPIICFSAEPAEYRVAPIYLPPLERPQIGVTRESLPRGSAGSLPSFDGESFHLSLVGSPEQKPAEELVRQTVNQILRAFAWDRDSTEIRFLKTVDIPPADNDFIEKEAGKALEETKRRVSGQVGSLSETTEKAIADQIKEIQSDAMRPKQTFIYEQHYRNIRLENSGIQVMWHDGRGLVSAGGRVFNDVNISNRRQLNENEAIKRAEAHVSSKTKVIVEPKPKPELVILPYGKTMRYAWRLEIAAEEGTYRLWVDAEDGKILQLDPLFWFDAADGAVFIPDPAAGTEVSSYVVNGPSNAKYELLLTGTLDVNNLGADGMTSDDLTIADAGSGFADFNVSPINNTTVDRTSTSGYNSRFQEVNAYSWIYREIEMIKFWGGQPLPDLTVYVNDNNACGYGINNACANYSDGRIELGVGQATVSNSTVFGDVFNAAIDATIMTHELGHIINRNQIRVSGGNLHGSLNEGLSDFWSATIHNGPILGNWWGQNRGAPRQDGKAPREAEALDVFPEHRYLNGTAKIHADGQMVNWALWNVRRGLNGKSALGTLLVNMNLLDALTTTGLGVMDGLSDRRVHDAIYNLLENLVNQFKSSSLVHKITAGFARAGITPGERDAIIDIDDDYLARGAATGPTFTVWTGRDYVFNGWNAVDANVFNTRYEIEVANDAAFSVNLISSGNLTNVAITAEGVPTATWTLPAGDWNTLKSGDYLYYRVTTTDGDGGNVRRSGTINFDIGINVDPAFAVINRTGDCQCTCVSGRCTVGAILVLPLFAAVVWRVRSRKKGSE